MRLNTTQRESGLVLHLKFDEPTLIHGSKAMDSSGWGNHGTLSTSDGAVNKSVAGKLGRGLSFDGSDDWVNTGKAVSTFFSASIGTMAVWIKPTGISPIVSTSYNGQGIVSDGSSGGGFSGIHRGIVGGTDAIWIYNYDNNEDKIAIPYTNDQWIHVVWIHSGGMLYAYKNGILVGSVASGNTFSITKSLTFGINYISVCFNGIIDEVRIYNRALSAGEVKALFENTKLVTTPMIVPKTPIPVIVNYYKHLRA